MQSVRANRPRWRDIERIWFHGAGKPLSGSFDPQRAGEFDRGIAGTGLHQQRIASHTRGKGAEGCDLVLLD